jgi:hypothetical protein
MAALVFAWSHGSALRPSMVRASGIEPLYDADGDSLPDSLEWVLMSDPLAMDSDSDGRDDFLEVVQHTSVTRQTMVQPVDHEMRVAVSCAPDLVTGEPHVWMHCMFRFASTTADVNWFMPFLSTGKENVPLTRMIGSTPMGWVVRPDSGQGVYGIFSMRLATAREFARSLPCSVNVRAAIGGRYICSSSYVFPTNGQICTLVPHGRDVQNTRLTVQTLMAHDGTSNTFFTGNRQCEQTMVLTGMSPVGPVYEIVNSECEVSEGMRCGSECPTQQGSSIVAPDGLGALTGR